MGHSERALGRVLPSLPREAIFVSTKAGYLPMGEPGVEENARQWFQRTLAGPGILGAEDLSDDDQETLENARRKVYEDQKKRKKSA